MSQALIDLLYEIAGIAMSIQREKGCSHNEAVYHDWLAARLHLHGYQVDFKPTIVVSDDLGNCIKKYQPDLRVHVGDISVLVELKATHTRLSVADQRQADAYLSVSPEDEAVLLVNFGRFPFEQKRVYQRHNRRGRHP